VATMMNGRRFSYMVMILGALAVLVGTGVLATDRSLLSLCQRGCWLNAALFAFFGEQGGKLAFALVWYLTAGVIFWFAIRLRHRSKSSPDTNDSAAVHRRQARAR
jgi:hypothetical protein